MIVLGVGASWIGILAEYLWWTKDWWHPKTITGTTVGLEDFLMSFVNLGICLFAYKLVFKKDTNGEFNLGKKVVEKMILKFSGWFIFSFGLTAILFYFIKVNSFFSTIWGMMIAGIYVAFKRKDLLPAMFWNSFIMAIVALPVYILMNFFSPGVVRLFWDFSGLSGILFLGIPVEDLLWYAMLGFFLGGAYEFLFDFKLINKN